MLRLIDQLNIRVLDALFRQDAMTPIRCRPNNLDVACPSNHALVLLVDIRSRTLRRLVRRKGIQTTGFGCKLVPLVSELGAIFVPSVTVWMLRDGFVGESGDVVWEGEPVVGRVFAVFLLLDVVPTFDEVLDEIEHGFSSNGHVDVIPRHTSGFEDRDL